MSTLRRLARSFRASDGRMRLGKLLGVSAVAILALLVGILPAIAQQASTTAGVAPATKTLSGSAESQCTQMDSAAGFAVKIDSPSSGEISLPGFPGETLTITIGKSGPNESLSYDFSDGVVAYDIGMKGGPQSNHYDNDGQIGALNSDGNLFPPEKNRNRSFDISHVVFCYDEAPFIDISVEKRLVAVNGETPGTEVNPGDTLDFDILVTNNGNGVARDVTVTDMLPDELEFVSATPTPTKSGQTLTWMIDIEAGATETLNLTASVNKDIAADIPNFSNPVSVSHSDDDDPSNDSATSLPEVTINRTEADLSVTKSTVGDNVVDVGENVTFEIVVKNSDASTFRAENVLVTDTLPVGLTYESASVKSESVASSPTIDFDGSDTVTWQFDADDFPVGEEKTLELVVSIDATAAGQELTNVVTVTSATFDPNDANNGDTNDNTADSELTVTADISGIKYHDRDTDGVEDDTEEEGLQGWRIAAFDSEGAIAGADETDSNGDWTIENLAPGTYTVCEETNTAGLPENGVGFTWSWTQSQPSGEGAADCTGFSGEVTYEPLGYTVTIGSDGDVSDIDFGNHTAVTIDCSAASGAFTVSLGEPGTDDNPLSEVTFPASCDSTAFTTTFDVGRSDDGDNWTQFVVFGGDPESTTVIDQTILWDAEEATYVDGSGNDCTPGSPGCSLLVPTTQVILEPGGTTLEPSVFCSSDSSLPNTDTPQCQVSRTIAEGAPLDPGYIQLTEDYKFLGDPGNFR